MRALLALCILLVAGCTSSSFPSSLPEHEVRHLSLGEPPGEEPLVRTDGTRIAVTARPFDDAPLHEPWMWTIDARNASFERIEVATRSPAGSAGQILDMDASFVGDALYVATMWDHDVEVARSSDGGTSWTFALGTTLAPPDRQWLVGGPSADGVSIVYMHRGTNVWIASSSDGGRTFRNVPVISTVEGGCSCAPGHPTVEATGEKLLIPLRLTPSNLSRFQEVGIALSEDAEWTRFSIVRLPATSGTLGDYGVIQSASAGGIMALGWEGPTGEGYGFWSTTSSDGGRTWSAPLLLTPPTLVAARPWLAPLAPGKFLIATYVHEGAGTSPSTATGTWRASLALWDTNSVNVTTLWTSEPVHRGPLVSQLRDFLSVARAGDDIVLAYADDIQGEPEVKIALIPTVLAK